MHGGAYLQEKDIILKEYQENSRHFCDFVNGVLAPVITIVFYYGAQIWSGPTD